MEDKNLPSDNSNPKNLNKIFLGILFVAIILGVLAGYMLPKTNKGGSPLSSSETSGEAKTPKTAQQDTRTFRDFAQGTIQKRPEPKNINEYVEGTHLLVRDGAVPVALTSSVIDLTEYEGKKVKVFGETQKAIKEGWLMDVGKVEAQ